MTDPGQDSTPAPSRLFPRERRFELAAWIILALAVLHPSHGTGLPICPSRLLTETPCPGCGLTRSVSCAIRADFSRSWYYHPFGVVFLAAVLALALTALLPAPLRRRVWTFIRQRRATLAALAATYWALLLLYGIARMAHLVGHNI